MNIKKIKQYLKQATQETLSGLIGMKNEELLVECNFNNIENITSRENLSNMIIALNGEKMFDNSQLRLELLKRLSSSEIKEIAKCMNMNRKK